MFATESPKKSPVDDGTQLFKTPEDERASEPGGKSAGPPGPAAATEIDGAPDRPAFSAPVIPLVEWREAIDPSGADLDMSVFTPENLATMTNTETQPAIAEKWSTPSKIQALPLFHFTRDLGVKILHSFDFHKNLRGQNVPSALMGLGNQAEMVEVTTQNSGPAPTSSCPASSRSSSRGTRRTLRAWRPQIRSSGSRTDPRGSYLRRR